MKKLCLLGILAILLSGYVFADEPENRGNEYAFTMVSMLLSMPDGFRRNHMQIQQLSTDLTDVQRIMLFNTHQTSPGLPLALNLLLGFGIGSAVQNDIAGTIVGVSGDAIGVLLTAFGVIAMLQWETVWERDPHTGWDIPRTVYPNFDLGIRDDNNGLGDIGYFKDVSNYSPVRLFPEVQRKTSTGFEHGCTASSSSYPVD